MLKQNATQNQPIFFLVRYEDSTMQTDTEDKEGEHEHSEINIRIKAIDLRD